VEQKVPVGHLSPHHADHTAQVMARLRRDDPAAAERVARGESPSAGSL
jgi:hypothetical protein